MQHSGTTLLENLEGAARITTSLLTPMLRTRRAQWGATQPECDATYPGDDLIPHPIWSFTHAITIDAQAADVWQWIIQLGQGRGGFYSYQKLENLAQCHIINAAHILPEYQTLNLGDKIHIAPTAPPFHVHQVADAKTLVLFSHVPGAEIPPSEPISLWSFHLMPVGDNAVRLIERGRYAYPSTPMMKLMMGPLFLEPVSFEMARKMLLGIKARAEQ